MREVTVLTRTEIERFRQRLGMTYRQLWIDYQDMGGSATASKLANYLRTGEGLSAAEHVRVVEAITMRLVS